MCILFDFIRSEIQKYKIAFHLTGNTTIMYILEIVVFRQMQISDVIDKNIDYAAV